MEDIWRGAPRPTQLCCGCFSKAFCQVYVSQARAPLLREKRKLRKPLDPRSFIVRSAHEKCRWAGPEAYQESGENAPAFSLAYGSNLLFYALDHDFPRATDSAQNDFLHRVVSAAVIHKFGVAAHQMNGIKEAAGRADPAADAAIGIHIPWMFMVM